MGGQSKTNPIIPKQFKTYVAAEPNDSSNSNNMKFNLLRLFILFLAFGFAFGGNAAFATPIPEDCQTGGFAIGCQSWTFNHFSVNRDDSDMISQSFFLRRTKRDSIEQDSFLPCYETPF
jgi:hypothetical protein